MEWHIWWVTRVSSLRFGYSGCTRTLRFNMSHTCLLGLKSIRCAGHWSVQCLFVTRITCVLLAAWLGCYPLPTSYHDWNGYEVKCFSYKTIHKEYFPTKKRQLHRREREAWVHIYFRTYRSARMVLYIKHVLFILIDRSVCIIQNNHFLDVLIKYIAPTLACSDLSP